MGNKLLVLLIGVVSISCHAAGGYLCTPNNVKEINRAIKSYIVKTAVSSKDVTISAKKCVGNYAYVEVAPNKPITDTAMVYLHKEGKGWKVMNWGTSFDEAFLAKLPKELRNP
ncbi:hypothetical protein [Legionella parisiensis]|uniref:Uncharacterized protein n=1 Tax=Legionella parisiensis TaxID=45071 RepID=A0A1E5JPT8_9GAMM|nr:hypothetical protein [Legionella parisiensis]KTD44402.1 hypothetical protein Lpar_0488 [Legionella parisiensis]OEH46544.1 hypothetical protein lpari_02485 [Legionella parisiensis]STX72029.1 Uncharacterised protein [Legionella parisiensis]